jgi:hypothetical protein
MNTLEEAYEFKMAERAGMYKGAGRHGGGTSLYKLFYKN